VLGLPALRPVGLHWKDARAIAGINESEAACELLPSVAVTTDVCGLLTVPAVGLKTALVAPPGTVTEGGSVSIELLSDSVTVVPVGADWFRVAVQVL